MFEYKHIGIIMSVKLDIVSLHWSLLEEQDLLCILQLLQRAKKKKFFNQLNGLYGYHGNSIHQE